MVCNSTTLTTARNIIGFFGVQAESTGETLYKDGVRCYMTKEGALVCERLPAGNYRYWATSVSSNLLFPCPALAHITTIVAACMHIFKLHCDQVGSCSPTHAR